MALRVRRDETAPREDGFTLVEMVVTVTIIAVLFVSVSLMLDSGLRAMAASKARARGNDIATQAIEDLQRYSYNNLGLCRAPSGTVPSGLEDTVKVTGWESCDDPDSRYENPCDDPEGSIPDEEYTCDRNNIRYTVKRYVAYVDALQTTKRLAVYVEWTDLVGNHRVSQQSSLRAPDQGAIVGLAPPTFQAAPTAKVNNSTPPPPVLLTSESRIDPSTSITFQAFTTNLNKAATGSTSVPAHQANAVLDITVTTQTGTFPSYNGFPVTGTNGEQFVVIAGAGTSSWKVLAKGSAASTFTGTVSFAGDKVFASIQTIGDNDSPQTATVFLNDPNPNNTWTKTLSSSSTHRFGVGSQYVSFGILRAADGKTAAAFATPALQFCPNSGVCSNPSLPTAELVADSVPTTAVALGTGGELQDDLVVKLKTTNVTGLDTVTVSFLTKAGTLTLALTPQGACAGPGTMTVGSSNATCHWTGTLAESTGYRFTTADQPFYFGVQQVLDADPLSVDKGSTAAVASGVVVFGQAGSG